MILLSTWMSLITLESTLHFLRVSMIKIILGLKGVINFFPALFFFLCWICFLGALGDSPMVT
jgi:hypothetical protein